MASSAVAARIPTTAPVGLSESLQGTALKAEDNSYNTATPSARTVAPKVQPSGALDPLAFLRITSHFGHRLHPVTSKWRKHEGVDLAAKLEQPVYAVLPGVVAYAGVKGGYGNVVEIFHSAHNTTSLYGHLNSIDVEQGQRIAKGHVIGGAGTTGVSTGVHLHFAVKNAGGDFIEPLAYLADFEQDTAPLIANAAPRKVIVATATRRNTRAVASTTTTRSSKALRTQVASSRQRSSKAAVQVAVFKNDKALPAAAIAAKPAPKPKVTPAQVADFEARVARAASEAERYSRLYEEGAISRNDRDSKLAAATSARTQLQAAKDSATN
jgi:hypothetical protein